MSDWIKHNGGSQPVDDDVWVETGQLYNGTHRNLAGWIRWDRKTIYRILNQHLIDVARLEGIRMGLEAAAKEVGAGRWRWSTWEENERMGEWAIRLQNVYKHCELLIHNLNPDTIARDVQTSSRQEKCDDLHTAREAVLDQLTSEAQADNMGYDNEPR